MTTYPLRFTERQMRRTFEKAVGGSILKILAELITNSDDSYRRLETKEPSLRNDPDFGVIRIVAKRKTRMMAAIDHAEGLDQVAMKENFVDYGRESDDRARGFRTRSLFGKGLRDVLFTQEFGRVKSIRDGKASFSEFRWQRRKGSDREPVIKIDPGPKVTSKLRKALEISGNGTRVEFKVRDDIPFPRHDTLAAKLRDFYMLRKINSNPARKIILATKGGRGEAVETEIRFVDFQGETLLSRVIEFTVEGVAFQAELEIYRAYTDLSQVEVGMENREGGLLVMDEDSNVLDLTLFKYDSEPAASRIFGNLKVQGAGDYIRKKLNSPRPEEVLTETREGLATKHAFYKRLKAAIEPVLEDIVAEERKKRTTSIDSFSDETQERIRDALDLLNDLYEDLVGNADIGDEFRGKQAFVPPVMAFIREKLAITENVVTPCALLINPASVPNGAPVSLSSSSRDVAVTPTEFSVNHNDVKEELLVKIVHLNGAKRGSSAVIQAEAPQGSATMEVSVMPEIIYYPAGGLGFSPGSLRLHDQVRRKMHLYVDTQRIPLGSSLRISVDNDNFSLDSGQVTVSQDHLVTDEVAGITIGIGGKGVGSKGTVLAEARGLSAMASVKVVSKKKKETDLERGRMFREPVFDRISLRVPSYMHLDGSVIINMNDEVNEKYFGANPIAAVELNLHSQVRMAELMLDECLNLIVTSAYGRTLQIRFPNDPATDIRMHIAELKFKIGPSFHSAFVSLNGGILETSRA